jgi:hypothetical protein
MKQHGIFQQGKLSTNTPRNMFGGIYEKKCIAENCSYGPRVSIIIMLLIRHVRSGAKSDPTFTDFFLFPKLCVS